METVLSTSREWVWRVDDQGVFTFSSQTSSVLLGWTPGELVGQPCSTVIDLGDLVAARGDVAATPGPDWSGVVVRCRHRDGSAVWMEVSGTVRPALGGQPGGFEGTSRLLPPQTAQDAAKSHGRSRLQRMIDLKMLMTAFQPIHDLGTGNLIGAEALTRFVSDNGAGPDF